MRQAAVLAVSVTFAERCECNPLKDVDMLDRLIQRLRRFLRDRAANVAIITGLAAIPLIGMLGFAIDYSVALSDKARLDAASDAAAMVAITTAKNIVNAQNGSLTSPTDAVAAGQAQGLLAFKANAGSVAFATVPTPTIKITTSGGGKTLTGTATYTTPVTNNFSKILGIATTPVKGTSVATLTLARYQDFYLLLDVSGSMGLPSTDDGQKLLLKVYSDGGVPCQFACHFPGRPGFDTARSNNIQLRADAVGNAVCQLLQKAQAQEAQMNVGLGAQQYRVGIYPFVVNMGTFFALNSNLTAATQTVTGNTDACSTTNPASAIGNLLDNGTGATTGTLTANTSNLGSGGTHFDTVLSEMSTTIPNSAVGDGSTTSSRQPFVFIVTDGMNNSQTYNNGFSGGSNPQPMGNTSASVCNVLTNRSVNSNKITVAVLYIPYTQLTTLQYQENVDANTATANIPAALTRCASPGYFFTANAPDDITTAMTTMFAQATQIARISQ